MLYGQITECRTRYLLPYFDDEWRAGATLATTAPAGLRRQGEPTRRHRPRYATCFIDGLYPGEVTKRPMASDVGSSPSTDKRRILIVDDNRNQLMSLSVLLGSMGYEVRSAADSQAALDTLREFVPDFALIDIGLPGMDGLQLGRVIRADGRFNESVLIAQSGLIKEDDCGSILDAGFDYCLVKPLNLATLQFILSVC